MEENNHSIAEGWKTTSFGEKDLFRIIGSGIKHFEGEKEYYSTSSIDANKVLFPEQVITYRNRPSRANMQPIQNSVWFAKMKNTFKILKAQRKDIEGVILSTGFSGIESKTVDCDYLMQILSSSEFNSQKNLLAEGSTQEAVNNTKIKEIKFLIPESNSEQFTIASILSKADEAISQTEQLIAKYSRIKTGLMQDLLTKGIDEHGNIRSEETHEFEDSPLGRIPNEWSVTSVNSLCKEIVVGIVIKPTQYYRETGIPMLRSQNITVDGIIMKDLVYMTEIDNNRLIKSKLSKDDVVSVRTGYPGTSAVVNKEIEGCNCIDLVISRVNQTLLNPHFLALWINSEQGRKQILNHQSGIAQQHFNVGQMKELMIIKLTISEQVAVLNKIDRINNQITDTKNQLSKLQSLKTGLMQDLLSGKVRVNHMIDSVKTKKEIV